MLPDARCSARRARMTAHCTPSHAMPRRSSSSSLTEELPPKALKTLGAAFADTLVGGAARARLPRRRARSPRRYATPRRLAVAITARARRRARRRGRRQADAGRRSRSMRRQADAGAAARSSTGLGRAHLATPTLDAADGPDRIYVASDGKADYVYLRSLAKGQPLARGAAGSARRGDRAAADPQGDELPGARQLLQRRQVRPARASAARAARRGRRPACRRSASTPAASPPAIASSAAPTSPSPPPTPTRRRSRPKARCCPSFAARRAAIVAELERRRRAGATVIMPDALLDEVTALVEWPAVYAGTFDRAFLAVPQECLILTMQQNQKYFALADDARHAAAPLPAGQQPRRRSDPVGDRRTATSACCARGSPTPASSTTRTAATPLAARVERCAAIVYHNKLGTLGDRVERLRFLARNIGAAHRRRRTRWPIARRCSRRPISSPTWSASFPSCRARWAATTRSTTAKPPAVADAIAQHYWPRFAGDALPEAPVAQAVALADKLEALAGHVRHRPAAHRRQGSVRPAPRRARRAAHPDREAARVAAARACSASRSQAFNGVAATKPRRPRTLADFLYERLRGYLRDQGYTANQVEAVLDAAAGAHRPRAGRGSQRCKAFEALPEADALAAANKRIVNILRKSGGEAAAARRPRAARRRRRARPVAGVRSS